MSAFSYEIDKDGIAVLSFDLPGEKVNKLMMAVMDELDRLLDELAHKDGVRAMVIRSGKDGHFIVGADIAEIRDIRDSASGEELARRGQAVFAKLEALTFPTVAAVHGPCMGGGLELALACTYRVISNDQRTALALPEVKLGIIPGFGGTQRLPRLVGIANALDMILTGKPTHARKARQIGLADEVTYKEMLLERSLSLARKAMGLPRPSGVRSRQRMFAGLTEGNPLTRAIIFRTAEKNVLAETRGNYPAPLAALDAVRYGFSHTREEGYRHEAELLGRLAPTGVSKNLISVFYLNELLKKDHHPVLPDITHAVVIGAGVMGGGIAQLLAEKGLSVRMKDIDTRALAAGFREAWGIFGKRRDKGILTPIQARDGFDRITATIDYTGFRNAGIAIEAVVENMDVKKAVLRELEAAAGESLIYASNTSSLAISELATASSHPDRVVGMHFFNPVEKMPLVEIVRGRQTSDETISAIATLSRRLGKLPVILNDGPGFLVNRILMPYLGEAVVMLEQGGRIEEIDGALLRFGMPMGAFILLDEIGIDIAYKVSEILHQGLGERAKPSGLLARLYKEGRLGKKSGRGFYQYRGGKRGNPDGSLSGGLPGPSEIGTIGPEDIVDRAVLLMVKEAVLCLEDRIISRPNLLDAALVFGIGFPPFRGGLLRYADTLGAANIVSKLEGFVNRFGERFIPPASLREMAKTGQGFYSNERSPA
ncbi:MAG TPA: 3-hydroxyacyl-CoA dehydrogenase NAD-binding domain-containing protein [Nitrospirota bacterium]|nr:3-hydroxyacyl-CoA dehydrogenase NAD-binding domain-containing protein [Nitrospirota bacterium]